MLPLTDCYAAAQPLHPPSSLTHRTPVPVTCNMQHSRSIYASRPARTMMGGVRRMPCTHLHSTQCPHVRRIYLYTGSCHPQTETDAYIRTAVASAASVNPPTNSETKVASTTARALH